ncbi:Asp-tRNA(Asn)/Glu-tRNA(Gln) amidotransferase subunit GatC [Phytomonospora endophytica]|uniref:Aspartyl/glutamyl-tRNA(Asn/Gln) amidotransferase subunit C n=1 Tax=Phytomonospora endophytica TaxID=714109 RepID=A0A841FE75_9ACTN|nr:Asp-tRNA(Asn)/Glu-tRNA(Gln) amidotransferase subunit GatC [Phytomonospora endophytica]MBB6034566.1 aspartyl-tRNA(Asn)/glutamyl-tRNA(Gln) amidotransferase subunit C [Phytomonospora endophytica]GIG71374.1 aspartyl/glutamyl-tRNA(Asn/Gln) amidotransferase subunit C [Phytomonospora endophytica]
MSAISRDEVAHLARLARLAVTEDELDRFAGQLDGILQSVARIGEVAADDIPPTSHSVPLTNVLRADEPEPSLGRDAVLAAAPDSAEDRFRVPRILDEEE